MPKMIDEAKIFRTVINLLVSRGYHGTTTKEIAKLTGINEATLFRKYGNKLGLIKRAFEHQFSTAPLRKVTYSGDLEADLYAILEAYVATNEAFGEIMPIVFLEIPRHPELRDVLQTPLENIQSLVNIIVRYQSEGRLKNEPPLTSVNVLLAPILLNQMFHRANIDMPVPAIDLHEYVKAFLHGRKPPTNSN